MSEQKNIYLDHSATSINKVPGLAEVMAKAFTLGNPGRSGHGPCVEATRVIFDAREAVAKFFEMENEDNLIFSSGASFSLNMVIQGLVSTKERLRVITTDLEHNSVARPLRHLSTQSKVIWKNLSASDGKFAERLSDELTKQHHDLVVVNHVSNVSGIRQDLDAIYEVCKANKTLFAVDASQSVGCEPLSIKQADLICAGGHKGLRGPMGIGFLAIGPNAFLNPIVMGGTGSKSDSIVHPGRLPDKLETGTPNLPGIMGLAHAVKYLATQDLQKNAEQLQQKRTYLFEKLNAIDSVETYGPTEGGSAISFKIKGKDIGNVAHDLWKKHGLCLRAGLHCSPMAHQALKTYPNGTLRVSPSYDTPTEHMDLLISALSEII